MPVDVLAGLGVPVKGCVFGFVCLFEQALPLHAQGENFFVHIVFILSILVSMFWSMFENACLFQTVLCPVRIQVS